MMGTKAHSFAPLPRDVSLEDLIPEDHFYRRSEAHLDLAFVRDLVAPLYAEAAGRRWTRSSTSSRCRSVGSVSRARASGMSCVPRWAAVCWRACRSLRASMGWTFESAEFRQIVPRGLRRETATTSICVDFYPSH